MNEVKFHDLILSQCGDITKGDRPHTMDDVSDGVHVSNVLEPPTSERPTTINDLTS